MLSLFNLSSMLISLCSPNTFNYVSTSYLNVKEMITTSDNNSYNSELREIGESLDVGYKREQIYPGFYHSTEYKTILKISFPKFLSSNILDSSLILTKKVGALSPIETRVYLKDTFNINDTTNPMYSSEVFSFSSSQTKYIFNITDFMTTALNEGQNYFYLSLSRNYNDSIMSFFSSSSSEENKPKLNVKFNSLPTNGVGSAPIYNYLGYGQSGYEGQVMNCYAHALDVKYWQTLQQPYCKTNSSENINNVAELFLEDMLQYHARCGRIIESYDSPIFNFEWRLALRFSITSNNELGGYHIIRESTNNGWVSKDGDEQTEQLGMGTNPDMWDWNNKYSSEIRYFAISKIGNN